MKNEGRILLELRELKEASVSRDGKITVEYKGYDFEVNIVDGGDTAIIKNKELGVRTHLVKDGNQWIHNQAGVWERDLETAVWKLLKVKI